MSIKALFFDFGGTIDVYPFVREDALKATEKMMEVLKDEGIDLGNKYTVDDFFNLVKNRNSDYKKWKAETLIELSEEDVWKNYILSDEKNRELLSSEAADELCYLMETGYHTRSVRKEMKELMESLSCLSLKTGIISNVLSKHQVPRSLVEYGLDGYFYPVVLSATFGRVKPNRSIFQHAADLAGVKPEECIYVGNSLSKDIFGAKNAGYKAAVQIEYSETDETNAPDIAPDFYIKDMRELFEIIKNIIKTESVGNV